MKDSRLILIREKEKILSMLLVGGRLLEVGACPVPEDGKEEACPLGSIYVGKVKNVTANINAAFVELSGGHMGFLPLGRRREAGPLNRRPDGRILPGDELLVQVEKEAVGSKDPVLTTEISLSGRYAVVFPGCGERKEKACLKGNRPAFENLHFSGKLSDKERKAITAWMAGEGDATGVCTDILSSVRVIVRTNAGELENYGPLTEEIRRLAGGMARILDTAGSRTCFSCLYRPEHRWLTEIRDTYQSLYEEILTDDEGLYEELKNYLHRNYPEEQERLRIYRDERIPLRSLYGLGTKLQEALDRRVWLKSGGYLIIEPTEALTVIDVNSGKYTGRRGAGDTFRLINREAAVEIARQLRLRNLSGMILVDFINMETEEDERELLACLAAEVSRDPVKTTVVDMTPLGLVEITRKKIRKSLREQLDG